MNDQCAAGSGRIVAEGQTVDGLLLCRFRDDGEGRVLVSISSKSMQLAGVKMRLHAPAFERAFELEDVGAGELRAEFLLTAAEWQRLGLTGLVDRVTFANETLSVDPMNPKPA